MIYSIILEGDTKVATQGTNDTGSGKNKPKRDYTKPGAANGQKYQKKDLQEQAGITASIMARLAKDENVQVDTISKICDALNCQPGNIMENIPKLQERDNMDALILKAALNPDVPPEGTKVITEEDVKTDYKQKD